MKYFFQKSKNIYWDFERICSDLVKSLGYSMNQKIDKIVSDSIEERERIKKNFDWKFKLKKILIGNSN